MTYGTTTVNLSNLEVELTRLYFVNSKFDFFSIKFRISFLIVLHNISSIVLNTLHLLTLHKLLFYCCLHDSYVILACGLDRKGKWSGFCESNNMMTWCYDILYFGVTSYSLNDGMTLHGDKVFADSIILWITIPFRFTLLKSEIIRKNFIQSIIRTNEFQKLHQSSHFTAISMHI